MKSFSAIVLGCLIGGILFVSATYNMYPQDTGEYYSYIDTVLIFGVISLITAVIFSGFSRLFNVKSQNASYLGATALVTQIAIYAAQLILPIYLGILGLAITILIFSAAASFLSSFYDH